MTTNGFGTSFGEDENVLKLIMMMNVPKKNLNCTL